jgi:hypothetical protein
MIDDLKRRYLREIIDDMATTDRQLRAMIVACLRARTEETATQAKAIADRRRKTYAARDRRLSKRETDEMVTSQYLTKLLAGQRQPMTFAEILAIAYPEARGPRPSQISSLRRALRRLVGNNNAVITVGTGGPGDPWRYAFNPIWVALGDST